VSLPAIRGHREVRDLLARAAARGALPQSVLLHGPRGVGKERLGLWLAQLLLCASEDPAARPCGRCQPCLLVDRLEHPDVHWFFPLPRPDAGSPEKLRDRLEELRAGELQQRRANPCHVPGYERPPAHFLASIQTLQQLAGKRPAVSARKVFVVGDVELMVPQESSPEAANAFLKLLEEPPRDTTLVLTTSSPGSLLPTIRSRVLPVRVTPLADAEVRDFLLGERLSDPVEAERIAALAGGAIGRALRLCPGADGPPPLERQIEAGRALLLAALAEGEVLRFAAAHQRSPSGARGDFLGELEALAAWLRDLLAVASGAPESVVHAGETPMLERAVARWAIGPGGVTDAILAVAAARELAQGNVNPQLLVADLLGSIRASLGVRRPAAPARA
jgi:DNA polymerase III subunit delta'